MVSKRWISVRIMTEHSGKEHPTTNSWEQNFILKCSAPEEETDLTSGEDTFQAWDSEGQYDVRFVPFVLVVRVQTFFFPDQFEMVNRNSKVWPDFFFFFMCCEIVASLIHFFGQFWVTFVFVKCFSLHVQVCMGSTDGPSSHLVDVPTFQTGKAS